MRTLLGYTLLRLAVFAACFGLLVLVFGRHVSLLLVAALALLLTSAVSLAFLRRQGAAAGESLVRPARRTLRKPAGAVLRPARALRRRFEEARSREDVD